MKTKSKRTNNKNKTRKKQFLYNPNDPKKSFDVVDSISCFKAKTLYYLEAYK